MQPLRDRPTLDILGERLGRSVGLNMEKRGSNIIFQYNNTQIIDDMKQLGFNIDILKVNGGEMPLPELAQHVDEQAALSAYWNAQAETARYKYNLEQDSYNYWFEEKYAIAFSKLQERGIAKPTQKEVESYIRLHYGKKQKIKLEKVRKSEYNYRILVNAICVSVDTKGRMMQTLRNIIQGDGKLGFNSSVETPSADVTSLPVVGNKRHS